jgi:GGDEF domain-containing protein
VPAPLGVSVGVATATPGEQAADLFARADAALYVDKHVPVPRQGTALAPAPVTSQTRRSPFEARAV